MIWFGWVLWHINHCRLFNAKSSLYRYNEYIWFIVFFNWNHFEMRLLNLRINFYLLRTFCPHLGSFLCCFFFHYVSAKCSPLAFFRWFTATSDKNDEACNRIPSNYCLPSLLSIAPRFSRWALSEDSGFKSYPSRREFYLVKNVVR